MIWLLYVFYTTGVYDGGLSLESREFKTKQACEFVQSQLEDMSLRMDTKIKTKCIGIKQ